MSDLEQFEIVAGLEIHIRLNMSTKAFCGDLNQYGSEPNINVSPISLAHPGTLPFATEEHIIKAVKLGAALGSKISLHTTFDRKHYFYPDLPKGYQITQERNPICVGGKVTLVQGKEIRIHHIHMEEDAGKLLHDLSKSHSLLDHNRAGVPLLELVTEPDFRSGKEVHDFIEHIIRLVKWLGVSDGNLEEGSLRCDCNVSIRKKGSNEFGERCEIKNLNSKKFASEAVEQEARRQYHIIQSGSQIVRQTLGFDPSSGKIFVLRKKESAQDYRYMPDPDLPPIQLSHTKVEAIKNEIHPLPDEMKKKFKKLYKLTEYEAEIICRLKITSELFESIVNSGIDVKLASGFILNKLVSLIDSNQEYDLPLSIERIKAFLLAIQQKKVSQKNAYSTLLPYLIENQKSEVDVAIDEMNLGIEDSDDDLNHIVKSVVTSFPEEKKRYKAGKRALIGFFIGEVIKSSQKKYDPKTIRKIIENELNN